MKRLISAIVLMIVIINGTVVIAEDRNMQFISEQKLMRPPYSKYPIKTDYDKEDEVERIEALGLILRIVGVEKPYAMGQSTSMFTEPILKEYYLGFHEIEPKDEENINYGYLVIARMNNIVFGKEYVISDFQRVVSFEPHDSITINEFIALIVRCMDKQYRHFDGEPMNLENTYLRAKELGIVKSDDEFEDRLDEKINYCELCLLAVRMLYSPADLYFEIDEDNTYKQWSVQGKTVSYIELLEERNNIDVSKCSTI